MTEDVVDGEFTEQKQDEQVLAYNGKGYKISDLSERSKALILQLQDLTRQRQDIEFKLEQINEASKGFNLKLEESVIDTPSFELKPE